jgi:hypothetical protein
MFGRRSLHKSTLEGTRRSSLQFEPLEVRTVPSATSLAPTITHVDGGAVYAAVSSASIQPLMTTEDWVRSLSYNQFSLLDETNVRYLTPQQIATIPDSGWFATISDSARRAMNQTQIQAINTASVRVYSLTQLQLGWLTENQIRSLGLHDYKYLSPAQVPFLTSQQLAAIPDPGPLAEWTAASRAALTTSQIPSLNVSNTGIYLLTPTQRAALTPAQIQSLSFSEFKYLVPTQIPILTPAQVRTIPDPGPLSEWTADARAALTQPQVQGINVAKVRIGQLTRQQIAWLTTSQIQSLQVLDFQYLHPEQIPLLTTQQIATIPDPGPLSAWTADARAQLTFSQVQALNVAKVRIYLLTPNQVSWLSILQVQSLDFTTTPLTSIAPHQIGWLTVGQIQRLSHHYFYLLNASQVRSLIGPQLASVDRGSFSAWSAASRGALTVAQVQSLNVSKVGLDLITEQQRDWITASQVASLGYADFRFVNSTLIQFLTPAQLSTMPSANWFAAWAPHARAALGVAQIQALDVAKVHLNLLTPSQLGWITATQVRSLGLFDFQFVNPMLVPLLTDAQIASIPDPGPFVTWTANARAALTMSQVRALKVSSVRLELLTPQQVSWLSAAQIQSLGISDFKYLSPGQVPWLTSAQLSSIPDPGPLSEWTAVSRAALTAPQVRALNVAKTRIHLLTPQQIAWLTPTQIQSLQVHDFSRLSPGQVPLLSIGQVASIPDPGPLNEWSAGAVAALTMDQVRALNVSAVHIGRLSPQQVEWLTIGQIQSLAVWDIARLSGTQIPWVTPKQFSQMANRDIIDGFSDEVRAGLTREQLLAMPWRLLPGEDTQTPPTNYIPAVDIPLDQYGIQATPHMTTEAESVFALVPHSAVTHKAIYSGNWSDPNVWQNGVIPSLGANVLISAGANVRFDVYQTTALRTLRIDGTLTFATNVNTQLKADTVVVFTSGKLHIGTATAPIAANVTARILIADNGSINAQWDPYLLSRGIISRGEVRIFGKNVTSQVALAVDPKAGDQTLYLAAVPVGWKVGDEIAIAGVNQYHSDFGTDRVRIHAIHGNVVTTDPLKYSHDAPDGRGLTVNVANLTRNIQFVAEKSSVVAERPHLAFIHNPNVIISGLGVYGFGRTDKTQEINSPIVLNGAQLPGTGTNARARYAMHFHHTGVGPASSTALVRNSVVDGSPGWGFVNHSSKVVFEYNVAYGVVGSGFATEDGNEVGAMRYNISMQSVGSRDFLLARRANHDFGHGGHGFWFQGPGIEVVGNIAAANAGAGFAYITSSSKNLYDAVNLDNPSLAAGYAAVPVGTVPLKAFKDNIAYSSQKGLDIWFHQLQMTDGTTTVENFTSWNTKLYGVDLSYSGRINIVNSRLFGDLNIFNGYGVFSNRMSHDVVLQNIQVEGFWNGVFAPPRGTTTIIGGRYGNIRDFYIVKGHDTARKIDILGAVQFAELTQLQLRGRDRYRFYLTGEFYLNDFANRKLESLFSTDVITVNIAGTQKFLLHYLEQGENFRPFPVIDSERLVPVNYVGKTNSQLRLTNGISFGGSIVGGSDIRRADVFGYAVPLS